MDMNKPYRPPFEIRDHTADIQLRVYGGDLRVLFRNATEALYTILGEIAVHPADDELVIALAADNPEELLHDWLSEALFYAQSRQMILRNINFIELTDTSLHAITHTAAIDMEKSSLDREIKAVTYHGLKVESTEEGLTADVIVDI